MDYGYRGLGKSCSFMAMWHSLISSSDYDTMKKKYNPFKHSYIIRPKSTYYDCLNQKENISSTEIIMNIEI